MAHLLRPKLIWTGICLLVLILFIDSVTNNKHQHLEILIPLVLMGLLTFPFGPLAFFGVAFVNEIAGVSFDTGMQALNVTMVWLIFYGVGYLQWFILLPRIRRELKNSRRP